MAQWPREGAAHSPQSRKNHSGGRSFKQQVRVEYHVVPGPVPSAGNRAMNNGEVPFPRGPEDKEGVTHVMTKAHSEYSARVSCM